MGRGSSYYIMSISPVDACSKSDTLFRRNDTISTVIESHQTSPQLPLAIPHESNLSRIGCRRRTLRDILLQLAHSACQYELFLPPHLIEQSCVGNPNNPHSRAPGRLHARNSVLKHQAFLRRDLNLSLCAEAGIDGLQCEEVDVGSGLSSAGANPGVISKHLSRLWEQLKERLVESGLEVVGVCSRRCGECDVDFLLGIGGGRGCEKCSKQLRNAGENAGCGEELGLLDLLETEVLFERDRKLRPVAEDAR